MRTALLDGLTQLTPRANHSGSLPYSIVFIGIFLKLIVSGALSTVPGFLLSKLIDVVFLVMVVMFLFIHLDYYLKRYPHIFLSFLLLVSVMLLSEIVTQRGGIIFALFEWLKCWMPLLTLMMLLKLYEDNRQVTLKWIMWSIPLILLLAIIGVVVLPGEVVEEYRKVLPAYFSNFHTSAYIMLCLLVLVYLFWTMERISIYTALVFWGTALCRPPLNLLSFT